MYCRKGHFDRPNTIAVFGATGGEHISPEEARRKAIELNRLADEVEATQRDESWRCPRCEYQFMAREVLDEEDFKAIQAMQWLEKLAETEPAGIQIFRQLGNTFISLQPYVNYGEKVPQFWKTYSGSLPKAILNMPHEKP